MATIIPEIDEYLVRRFYGKVLMVGGGCWEWQAGLASGYGRIRIGKNFYLAHRVSYWIHFGEDPKEMDVCHKCDNRKCVRPSHLFLGTRSDNMKDCRDKGRMNMPWKDTNILDTISVEEVCLLVADAGVRGAAKLLGCTHPTVSKYLQQHQIKTKYENGKKSTIVLISEIVRPHEELVSNTSAQVTLG